MSHYYASYKAALDAALSNTAATVGGITTTMEEALEAACMESRSIQGGRRCQFFAGNGASAAFGGHMALDWSKNAGVRSLAITDPALITATANDLGLSEMFAGPISWFGSEGDLLVTVSSSGNSANVIRAIEAARTVGMRVVTLSGLKPDNSSRQMGDINFYVPAKTYGIVECAHQVLLHAWLDRFLGLEEWNRETEQDMNVASYVR